MYHDEPVKLKVESRIAHIVLDKPPQNRMNGIFLESLSKAIRSLINMEDVGAVVVYGSGRHFSAGADIENIKNSLKLQYIEGKDANVDILTPSRCLRMFELIEVPTIAAINGLCMGSGLEVALACDIRICSDDSIMGSPELSWGIVTGLGGSFRLERLVGKCKALEMLLKGNILNGQEAYKIGLVNEVVNRKEVLPCALEMAKLFSDENRSDLNGIVKRSLLEG